MLPEAASWGTSSPCLRRMWDSRRDGRCGCADRSAGAARGECGCARPVRAQGHPHRSREGSGDGRPDGHRRTNSSSSGGARRRVCACTLRTAVSRRGRRRQIRSDLRGFQWDTPVVKVNYALDRPIPWRSQSLAGAGTVHVGADTGAMVRWAADLETGVVPESPFLLVGQMTTTDPSRSPVGTESCWAYTHLPRASSTTLPPTNSPGGWTRNSRRMHRGSTNRFSDARCSAPANWKPQTPTWSEVP